MGDTWSVDYSSYGFSELFTHLLSPPDPLSRGSGRQRFAAKSHILFNDASARSKMLAFCCSTAL